MSCGSITRASRSEIAESVGEARPPRYSQGSSIPAGVLGPAWLSRFGLDRRVRRAREVAAARRMLPHVLPRSPESCDRLEMAGAGRRSFLTREVRGRNDGRARPSAGAFVLTGALDDAGVRARGSSDVPPYSARIGSARRPPWGRRFEELCAGRLPAGGHPWSCWCFLGIRSADWDCCLGATWTARRCSRRLGRPTPTQLRPTKHGRVATGRVGPGRVFWPLGSLP